MNKTRRAEIEKLTAKFDDLKSELESLRDQERLAVWVCLPIAPHRSNFEIQNLIITN